MRVGAADAAQQRAEVAELADALRSGRSDHWVVWVRVPPPAPRGQAKSLAFFILVRRSFGGIIQQAGHPAGPARTGRCRCAAARRLRKEESNAITRTNRTHPDFGHRP